MASPSCRVWAAASLLLLAVFPYADSLANGFVWDDKTQLLANPYLADFHHWHPILTSSVWSFQGPDASGYYRPLMLGIFLLLRAAGGHAWMFHLASVVLHAAVVLLLYGVTIELGSGRGLAWGAAALFAVHPMHSEAVDWIAASADLELALFFLLAFYFFLTLEEPRRRGWHYGAMTVCYALALLAKEPALMLAPLATVFEHGFRARRQETPWTVKAARYAPLWLVSAAYLFTRHTVLGTVLSPRASFGEHVWALPLAALALLGQYAARLILPYPLSAYHLFRLQPWPLLPWAAAGALLLAGTVWMCARQWGSLAAFGLLWLLLTLVPVLNPDWLAANAFAERYAYLPSVGFCWLAAWVVQILWARARAERGWRTALAVSGTLVLVAGGVMIAARNRVWHDDMRLYTTTLEQEPDAYWLRQNLGALLWARHDTAGAAEQWREAVREAPGAEPIWANLGMLELDQRRYAQAATALRQALRLTPADGTARRNLAQSEIGLGEREFAAGRYTTAAALYRRAVSDGGGLQARLELGLADWQSGEREEALATWRRAEASNPAASQPHYLLALYCATLHRVADAQREFVLAVRLDPDNSVGIAAYRRAMAAASSGQRPR